MKLKFLSLILISLLSINAFSNASLFSYNEAALENEFAELNELENYVVENALSLNDLVSGNSEMLSSMNLDTESSAAAGFSVDDMDWGAFLWGFCCGPCGVGIVYLQKEKRTNERMVSSLIGWGVAAVINIITYAANPGAIGL